MRCEPASKYRVLKSRHSHRRRGALRHRRVVEAPKHLPCLLSRGRPRGPFLSSPSSLPVLRRTLSTTAMSQSLYAACAQVLSVCQATKDDLDTLLHPETGFAPRLRDICFQECVSPHSALSARSLSSGLKNYKSIDRMASTGTSSRLSRWRATPGPFCKLLCREFLPLLPLPSHRPPP